MGGAALASCTPSPTVINMVGSDTTQDLMAAIATAYNGSQASTDNAKVFAPPAVLASGGSFAVQGDGKCAAFNYTNPGALPPNGSSAGISALVNDASPSGTDAGCVDVARSSRGRSASDPSSIEFYAFAKDAVSWARFTGGSAPATLTQAQLQGIFLCTSAGNPTITNWNQVGGANAPIIRYLPQTGSGTLSFFETRILGLTSAQQGVLDGTSCNTAPIRVEENHGNQVVSGNRPNAILPYSYAQWTAQKNAVVPDDRAGALLGSIGGVAPSPTTVNNGTFLGRRWVYNVLKNTGTNSSYSYSTALKVVGVTASTNGFLCKDNSSVQSIVTQYGFIQNPLGAAGPGLPNSRCRKDPTPL
jgi:phosphate transport system substrate-binding protein